MDGSIDFDAELFLPAGRGDHPLKASPATSRALGRLRRLSYEDLLVRPRYLASSASVVHRVPCDQLSHLIPEHVSIPGPVVPKSGLSIHAV